MASTAAAAAAYDEKPHHVEYGIRNENYFCI